MNQPFRLAAFALTLTCGVLLRAETEYEAAVAQFKAKRYPEARAALEKVVVAEPKNAAACHYLGLAWKYRNDNDALETAIKWLKKATELDPTNATYWGDFGGTSLQYAGRTRSVSAATSGRDAMEKALSMNPDYHDAREGLIQFYTQAPWPIGSSGKANAHLAELRKRAPDRGAAFAVQTKTQAKEYPEAFKICDELLAKDPSNYTALYQYGRTASLSGQNLERGLTNLKKCLEITPPGPTYATHSNVWNRIGVIQEKLQKPAEARSAYETAIKLDPNNRQATDALAKLKQ